MAGTYYKVECFKRIQVMIDLTDELDVILHPPRGALEERYDIQVHGESVLTTSNVFIAEAYISGFMKGIKH